MVWLCCLSFFLSFLASAPPPFLFSQISAEKLSDSNNAMRLIDAPCNNGVEGERKKTEKHTTTQICSLTSSTLPFPVSHIPDTYTHPLYKKTFQTNATNPATHPINQPSSCLVHHIPFQCMHAHAKCGHTDTQTKTSSRPNVPHLNT